MTAPLTPAWPWRCPYCGNEKMFRVHALHGTKRPRPTVGGNGIIANAEEGIPGDGWISSAYCEECHCWCKRQELRDAYQAAHATRDGSPSVPPSSLASPSSSSSPSVAKDSSSLALQSVVERNPE